MLYDKFVVTLLLALLAFFLIWLIVAKRRIERTRRAAHTGYFDGFLPYVTKARHRRNPSGFGRVSGDLRGYEVDLQAVPDALGTRKLPALWILASLIRPLPLTATFDLMIRPTGIETFSKFGQLAHEVPLPPGFPANGQIRTDDPAGLPPGALIRPHLAMFDDPRMKELLIGPQGVRIVWLAEEADRSRYLIFRDAELGYVPLSGEAALALAELLIGVAKTIEAHFGGTSRPVVQPQPQFRPKIAPEMAPVVMSDIAPADAPDITPEIAPHISADGAVLDPVPNEEKDPLKDLFRELQKDLFKSQTESQTESQNQGQDDGSSDGPFKAPAA